MAATQAMFGQIRLAVAHIVERLTPSLVEVGNCVVAGVTAFILVLLAPLLTVGCGMRGALTKLILVECYTRNFSHQL